MRILFCVPQDMLHLHNKFLEEIRSYFPHLEIIGGLPKSNDIYDDLLPKLLIMDDLMSEMFREAEMTHLFTRLSRHNNISLVFTTQNYFDSGHTKTIVRQCNVQIIFDNPMDKVLTRSIGGTIVPKQPDFLNNCFDSLRHFFPLEKYPYVMIDGNANKNMNDIMFRSHIFPDEANQIKPICFFVNPQYSKKR
jgi:hypothetical protein